MDHGEAVGAQAHLDLPFLVGAEAARSETYWRAHQFAPCLATPALGCRVGDPVAAVSEVAVEVSEAEAAASEAVAVTVDSVDTEAPATAALAVT